MSRIATQPMDSTAPTAPPARGVAPDAVAQRSAYLDASLDRAHKFAVGQRHAGVSSEHLLFALTEDPEALGVLGASTVSVDRLRADIGTHLAQLPADAPPGKPVLPNGDLVKVLKLAAMAAQQSARRQIDGAIVLAAMIGDASTPSAGLLRAHGLTFNEVIRVLQKGVPPVKPATSVAPAAAPLSQAGADHFAGTRTAAGTSAEALGDAFHKNAGVKDAGDTALKPADASTPSPQPAGKPDDLLASVRARLQQSAPAKPRPADRPSPEGSAAIAAPVEQAVADRTAEPPTTPPPAEPPTISLDPARSVMTPPAADGPPRHPEDLSRPLLPSARERTQPVATLSQSAPPLPAPMAAPRGIPPPLPNPTAFRTPGPQALPLSVQAVPRVPPIPPPTIDLRALLALAPATMRQGTTSIVEIMVPRRALEIPMAAGHRWPPLRVATMRLSADPETAHVELASPETLWISPPRVHQGAADEAIWRWRVTPRTEGLFKLTLAGATRIVGGEGISGEVPFGEESTEVEVTRRGSRRWLVGLLVFSNLGALGLLAMIMSGRASELLGGLWSAARRMIGG